MIILVALRCNLVTLSDEEDYADKTMLDYSIGLAGFGGKNAENNRRK